jgi:excisionase family DNA binding protein
VNESWPDYGPPPEPNLEADWPPIPTWHRDAEYWIGSIDDEEVARIWMGKPAKSLPRDPDGYLTIDEAAAYLHQSRSWTYQQIRSGGLPTYGPRGNQKIRRTELEAWMAGRRQRPASRRASVENVLASLTSRKLWKSTKKPKPPTPLPTDDIKCKIQERSQSDAPGGPDASQKAAEAADSEGPTDEPRGRADAREDVP